MSLCQLGQRRSDTVYRVGDLLAETTDGLSVSQKIWHDRPDGDFSARKSTFMTPKVTDRESQTQQQEVPPPHPPSEVKSGQQALLRHAVLH